jgi:hypothetical protein
MQKTIYIISFFVLALSFTGCKRSKICTVTVYGSDFMTTDQKEPFNNACREVLYQLSYKEEVDANSVKRPYYGEGGKAVTENKKVIASKAYLKTKDEQNYEYIITSIVLGENEPVVILETTNPDKYKLVNTLLQEFHKRGFNVRNY